MELILFNPTTEYDPATVNVTQSKSVCKFLLVFVKVFSVFRLQSLVPEEEEDTEGDETAGHNDADLDDGQEMCVCVFLARHVFKQRYSM